VSGRRSKGVATKTFVRIVVVLLAIIGALAIATAIRLAAAGVSARPEPSRLEAGAARAARHLLIPHASRAAANPVEAEPEVLVRARAHFADHCAACHGNDGRGDTELGRGLYPRTPDMTLRATQELSDGELFWIIENGVRLTGMPAWGDPGGESGQESWELVHFIRRLPALTAEEIAEMERHNPVSRAELEEEEEMRQFLGEDGAATEAPAPHHHH
jgi:mono/diheme cytochrome c family protein